MSLRPRDASKAAPGPAQPSATPHPVRPLRPDAQRNTERVLSGARQAFAAAGLGAGYHDIARLAGVGVGTVYRRFPDPAKLMEAVLLDILDELSGCAEHALARTDAWPAFADFFTTLALRTREHAGLSESLDERGGSLVAAARHRLIGLMHTLADRAQRQGVLRGDLAWQDIPFLARVAVDVDHRVPVVNAQRVEARDRADAGVADEDVEPPEPIAGKLHQRLKVRALGDVRGFVGSLSARGFDLARDRCDLRLAPGTEHDFRPARGQKKGRGPADAPSGSGDRDNFVLDAHDEGPSCREGRYASLIGRSMLDRP